MGKRVLAVITAVLIAITAPFTAYCSQINPLNGIKNAVEGVFSYKCSECGASSIETLLDKLSENAGTYYADWYYIAFSGYGLDCKNQKSVDALKAKANSFYSNDIKNVKVTDMQRVAFALSACGADITNVNGHNLLADATYNRAKVNPINSQGVNSVAYALLLLDSKNYKVPDNASTDRDAMIRMILKAELPDGGFALFGKNADIDITSIAVQALAPYKKRADVKSALDKCVSILSDRQDITGGYKSFSNEISCESTAQVILCLTAMGINPINDSRFIKDTNSVMDGLEVFRLDSGAFSHFRDSGADNMATYQALCALVSIYRYLNGEKSFYDFSEKPKPNKVKVVKQKKISSNTNKSNNNSIKENKSSSSTIFETQKPTEKPQQITKETSPKSKTKKKKKSVSNITPTAESTTATYNNNSVKGKSYNSKSENKRNPLYIDFIVLMIMYAVLVVIKRRAK